MAVTLPYQRWNRRKHNEGRRAYEKVNHPQHYGGDTPYETIKVIEAWGLDTDFCLATCIRYISRAGNKPGEPVLDDLRKAAWYLSRKIQRLELQEVAKSVLEASVSILPKRGPHTRGSGKSSRMTKTGIRSRGSTRKPKRPT